MNVESDDYTLGGAGNVANNLASLKVQVTLIGMIGKDHQGDVFKDICKKKGIRLLPYYDNRPTIVKQRFMAHGQQIARVDREQRHPISDKIAIQISKDIKKIVSRFDAIIFSDYNKGFLTSMLVREVIGVAKKSSKRIYVGPKPQNMILFRDSTLICCNIKEAKEFTDIDYDGSIDTLRNIGKKIMQELNPEHLTITLSEKGMFTYDNKGNYDLIPTRVRQVIDVSGAGDTVLAVLTLANLSKDIHDSAKLANHAAGIVVEKVGTATVTQDELIKSITQQD
jgi:rfaE bifunctional protein kinase chain/domain